ncbi:hypothetical protein [Meiothermus rufus]|uniref:hypothetical protein n=1 Tax=Meiothermus rufus TaxID=604332 RepID=UPI0003F8E882|nr:hypothetical protein [Meiothermus rufus]
MGKVQWLLALALAALLAACSSPAAPASLDEAGMAELLAQNQQAVLEELEGLAAQSTGLQDIKMVSGKIRLDGQEVGGLVAGGVLDFDPRQVGEHRPLVLLFLREGPNGLQIWKDRPTLTITQDGRTLLNLAGREVPMTCQDTDLPGQVERRIGVRFDIRFGKDYVEISIEIQFARTFRRCVAPIPLEGIAWSPYQGRIAIPAVTIKNKSSKWGRPQNVTTATLLPLADHPGKALRLALMTMPGDNDPILFTSAVTDGGCTPWPPRFPWPFPWPKPCKGPDLPWVVRLEGDQVQLTPLDPSTGRPIEDRVLSLPAQWASPETPEGIYIGQEPDPENPNALKIIITITIKTKGVTITIVIEI